MKKTLLFVYGFFWCLQGMAQTEPDRIYLLDQQVMQAWVDEIGEKEILYFTKGEPPRQAQKIALSLVWKVVFANGDVELIQPASARKTISTTAPAVEKYDQIHTRSSTILEGKIMRVEAGELIYVPIGQQSPRSISEKDVQKIVYSDGRTENLRTSDIIPFPATPERTPSRQVRGRSKSRRYLGLLAGGIASNFYRSQFYPLPDKLHLDWEAGLVGSPLATRYYQARLELLYANKGAVETFKSSSLTVQSESRLTYLQANVLPLILKTGSDRVNFALGAGGYCSYLIQASSRSDLGTSGLEDDPLTLEQFDVPTDYGLMAIAGLYIRHKPVIEVRYTHGLGQLMTSTSIRVQGIHVSLFLIF